MRIIIKNDHSADLRRLRNFRNSRATLIIARPRDAHSKHVLEGCFIFVNYFAHSMTFVIIIVPHKCCHDILSIVVWVFTRNILNTLTYKLRGGDEIFFVFVSITYLRGVYFFISISVGFSNNYSDNDTLSLIDCNANIAKL